MGNLNIVKPPLWQFSKWHRPGCKPRDLVPYYIRGWGILYILPPTNSLWKPPTNSTGLLSTPWSTMLLPSPQSLWELYSFWFVLTMRTTAIKKSARWCKLFCSSLIPLCSTVRYTLPTLCQLPKWHRSAPNGPEPCYITFVPERHPHVWWTLVWDSRCSWWNLRPGHSRTSWWEVRCEWVPER